MLLRRMTEHVKAQNWTAVGLDLLVVVVGVFVGIQVSNWNEARQDRERGRLYMERMRADLQAEIEVLENRIDYFRSVHERAVRVVEALEGPREALDRAFLVDLVLASGNWRYTLRQDAYDELVSTGEVPLVEDPAVRTRLSRYYRDLARNLYIFDRPNDLRDAIVYDMPVETWRGIVESCLSFPESVAEQYGIVEVPDCRPDVTEEAARVAADRVLGPGSDGVRALSRTANGVVVDLTAKLATLETQRRDASQTLAVLEGAP